VAQIDHVALAPGGGKAAIAGMWIFTASLTPVALSAAVDLTEQTFATIGSPVDLVTTDQILVAQPPGAIGAHCCAVGARATAAQTIVIQFGNWTAAANVPAAGLYCFTVIRA